MINIITSTVVCFTINSNALTKKRTWKDEFHMPQSKFYSLPFLFLTSMNPFCLILCKKSLPKRPLMPLFRLNRPEILTTVWTSLYFEAYKSTTFPPVINLFLVNQQFKEANKSSRDIIVKIYFPNSLC